MNPPVITCRINAAVSPAALDEQIANLCEVNAAAGYTLAAAFMHGADLLLIFRRENTPPP